MVMRKFLFLALTYILILLFPLPNYAGEDLFDKVAITRIEFFQKGRLTEVASDDAPVRIRAHLKVNEIKAEFRDKFLLIFYVDGLPLSTFPISDIRYTPFIDCLWETPTAGHHSIGASLSTTTDKGERVSRDIFVEEVKPVLKINSLEIDTTRKLVAGDKVKFFLFVSNISEKVILPDDFIAKLELKAKKEERTILLDFKTTPRIGAKAHNVCLGPIDWVVEDGDWLVYPQIIPRVVDNRKVLEVVKDEAVFLDLRIGELRPDLFLDLSLSPSSPYMGDKVKILANVENRGDFPCEKYSLFLYVDGRKKGSIMGETSILPGETKNFQFDWTAERGRHYLKVSVPYEFDRREFLTRAELSINVETGINLLPVILSFKPDQPQSGDILTVLTRIENKGVNSVTPWDEGKGMGYKAVFSVDGIQREVKFDKEILPGEKGDFEFNWEAEEGEHLLKFSSFYYGPGETEPLIWSVEKLNKVLPPPKLVCVRDSWMPNPPTVGDMVEISLVVRNDGKGVARQWDEVEKVGYKMVFFIGSLEKEDSKMIPPGKEVTFSFSWKVNKEGKYPVKVLFIDSKGREIVKPYTGTLTVLSSEPIDELGKEALKLLEKWGKKKVSVYKLLEKELQELLHPFPSHFEKIAKKSSRIALQILNSIFEQRHNLPFSDETGEDKDLLEVSKNMKEIVEDIDRIDWESISHRVGKLESDYANLREYIFHSLFSEVGIVSLLGKEVSGYRQMIANNLAVKEGKIRPYPNAKNELLEVLGEEEKWGNKIYQDFQKEKSEFTFLKREAERDEIARIQLSLLKSIITILKSEEVRAQKLKKDFYNR
jgi:hypothetical protein